MADDVKVRGAEQWTHPDFLDLIQQPYFEDVAKKVLKADAVYLCSSPGIQFRGPSPSPSPYEDDQAQWAFGCHIDVQATLEDFEATPRRVRADLWLWLSDVPADRAAMRVLPGSHRSILAHWGRVLLPEHKAKLPRIHGVWPVPRPECRSYPECIPDTDATPWAEQEPIAAVARRGQLLVACNAGLHSAWENGQTETRKALVMPWAAEGVPMGLPPSQVDDASEHFSLLRAGIPADRAHIAPDPAGWAFGSAYAPEWQETFLPDQTDYLEQG